MPVGSLPSSTMAGVASAYCGLLQSPAAALQVAANVHGGLLVFLIVDLPPPPEVMMAVSPGRVSWMHSKLVVQTDAVGTRTQTPATVRLDGGVLDVSIAGKAYAIQFEGHLRDIAVHGMVNGAPFSAQIERLMLAYRVTHHGAQVEVRVLSPRAAELNALMPFKAPPDLSRYLLSPMPGLLVDVAVQPGQVVRAGERLAVIEAMKMENILLAVRDGVVSKVLANKGESLAVDQVIMEFERAEVEA
jgi:acetyl/propionyl-CoA carboxylase alpha subunit